MQKRERESSGTDERGGSAGPGGRPLFRTAFHIKEERNGNPSSEGKKGERLVITKRIKKKETYGSDCL